MVHQDSVKQPWQWISHAWGRGREVDDEVSQKCVDLDGELQTLDDMERGLAREVATDFLQPLRKSSRLWRFNVMRSANKLEYKLFTDAWDFLMIARVSTESRKVSFFLYDSMEDVALERRRPAFHMTYSSDKKEWCLMNEQCENCLYLPQHRSCNGKQVLAVIKHVQESAGTGTFNGMEVHLPIVHPDGERAVWCPVRGGCDQGHCVNSEEMHKLVTLKPAWNDEVDSLVLDFRGRRIETSSKNFQIAGAHGHVICQFGKVGPATYGLDFNHPLSVVQAFAMGLSTMFWK
mmetsp:Transcript_40733/g.73587  ORF Transcript_40733/g.73587 Transcript_40733/m.73587 type:complete len:290 (-) Transcript_40733:51-920(-)